MGCLGKAAFVRMTNKTRHASHTVVIDQSNATRTARHAANHALSEDSYVLTSQDVTIFCSWRTHNETTWCLQKTGFLKFCFAQISNSLLCIDDAINVYPWSRSASVAWRKPSCDVHLVWTNNAFWDFPSLNRVTCGCFEISPALRFRLFVNVFTVIVSPGSCWKLSILQCFGSCHETEGWSTE